MRCCSFAHHRGVTCQGCNQDNWSNAAKLTVNCAASWCDSLKWYLEETSSSTQWDVSFSCYHQQELNLTVSFVLVMVSLGGGSFYRLRQKVATKMQANDR